MILIVTDHSGTRNRVFGGNHNQPTIVIFYTEILTGKVVLWSFFLSETSEKIYNSTFLVKISV